MSPGLDLYYTDPARHIITAGQYPDDLGHDLSDLSVRPVKLFEPFWDLRWKMTKCDDVWHKQQLGQLV